MKDELIEKAIDLVLEDGPSCEGKLADIGHVSLDLAGVGFDIFGAGSGAIFDATNAIWYAAEKNYLYAALSLVSAIPIVGDIIGKGGKYLHKIGKARKAGAHMYKAGKVMKSPRTVAKLKKIKVLLASPKVTSKMEKIFNVASKNEKMAPHVDNMRSALDDFSQDEIRTA